MQAKNLIGGLMVGAALGVTAGLLLAPRSGEQTRRKILKGSMKFKRGIVDYVDASVEKLREQFNQKMDHLAKRGRETINHVSEKIKA